MRSPWITVAPLLLVLLSSACTWRTPVPAHESLRLWIRMDHHAGFMHSVSGKNSILALIDRAAAAGYSGMMFQGGNRWLRGTDKSGRPLAPRFWSHLEEIIGHARTRGIEFVPAIAPVGVANAILPTHPHLVEGSPVRNVPMRVSADGTRARIDAVPTAFKDGGFETFAGDSFSEWDWQDASGTRSFVDTSVAHSGLASVRLEPQGQLTRIVQRFAVEPWKLYRLSAWVRTESLTKGLPSLAVYGLARDARYHPNISLRSQRTLSVAATQDWTRFDLIVNSGDSPLLRVYLIGSSAEGTIWFDDVEVEEVALVNVTRGPGGPVLARSRDGSVFYTEGSGHGDGDFDPIVHATPGRYRMYSEPLEFRIPPGSRLRPDQVFLLDFYSVVPVDRGRWNQVAASICGSMYHEWLRGYVRTLVPHLPADTDLLLMGLDEIRHMNTSAVCAAQDMDAGETLARFIGGSIDVLHEFRPTAGIYVWSDMLTPHHNAVDHYYQVKGSLAGSWEGLPPEVIIVNWARSRMAHTLRFFEELGHPQLISADNGGFAHGAAASATLDIVMDSGVRNVTGIMYTTWVGDYDQLEDFARAVRTHPWVTSEH